MTDVYANSRLVDKVVDVKYRDVALLLPLE
eukprot:COSAG01_NODE_49074_length_375_cov_0.942029_1_plen_29_part_10